MLPRQLWGRGKTRGLVFLRSRIRQLRPNNHSTHEHVDIVSFVIDPIVHLFVPFVFTQTLRLLQLPPMHSTTTSLLKADESLPWLERGITHPAVGTFP